MPGKDKVKLLDIMDKFEDFVEKLMCKISVESNEGNDQFIALIANSLIAYKKVWHADVIWRARVEQVNAALIYFKEHPDAPSRLAKLKELIKSGKWNEKSSYNYFLFIELINSVTGYAPLKDFQVMSTILTLNEKLTTRMNTFLAEYAQNQQRILAKQAELKATKPSAAKLKHHIELFTNSDDAKAHSMQQTSHFVFSLAFKEPIWYLNYTDFKGKVYKLEPNDELIQILCDYNVHDVSQVNLLVRNKLNAQCYKILEDFLKKTSVLINPKHYVSYVPLSNDALIETNTRATFVLRGESKVFKLTWIDTLGKAVEISLDKNPELKQWLQSLDKFKDEDIARLTTHLLHVNIKTPLGRDDFKTVLSKCHVFTPKVNETKPLKKDQFGMIEDMLKAKMGIRDTELEQIKVGTLKNDQYSAVSRMFPPKEKVVTEAPIEAPKPI